MKQVRSYLRSATSLSVFEKKMLKFIRPSPNSLLIVTTTEESNTSQDYALAQVIYVRIN